MRKCNKCGAPMAESNTGMGYCMKCGAWSKLESEPVKAETPTNVVGTIEVALDEKTYEPFMREAQDPNSPMRKAIAQAKGETEVREAITDAIARMRNGIVAPIPSMTLTTVKPATTEIVNNGDGGTGAQPNLVRYPTLVPSATVANQQAKTANEIRQKSAKAAAELAEAKKAEEAKDDEAVRKTILVISRSINKAIQEGSFITTVEVMIRDINSKNENYYKVKKYFTDLGYQVSISMRTGDTFYVNIAWKTTLN